MFKALAEGWNWTPGQVESLTPTQLIKLSGQAASGGGGPMTVHPSQYNQIREMYLAWNSPEALLRRAERRFAKYQARQDV